MAARAAAPLRIAAAVGLVVWSAAVAAALPVDELDPEGSWALRSLVVEGPSALSAGDVRAVMSTHPRPWWAPWRGYPTLDPVALREDVDRVKALYRQRGHYEAAVQADAAIAADGKTVDVVMTIVEGPPVHVGDVDVRVDGERLPDLDAVVARLPVRRGDVFDERDYDAARRTLRRAYREATYARVRVVKHARVDLDAHTVAVRYTVTSGPPCVFGTARVTGTKDVDPAVPLAEVAFRPGDPFRGEALERTRSRLQATHLFTTVRVEEEGGTSPVVDVVVDVREAPPRDVRLGLGYDTEEGVRGIAGWRHYDFFGGGRQLGFTARASFIERSAAADFLQPHWPVPDTRVRLLVANLLQDEESYDVTRSRLVPRLEWQIQPDVTAYCFYRLEYDDMTHVPVAVQRALPDAHPKHSTVSATGIGIDGLFADDPIDPRQGVGFAASAETAGLGGDVHFVRAIAEGTAYQPLGLLGLLGAARLRVGVVGPYGGDRDVPLFERLYAGGINSVRGYERWHVGRLADDDPLGGQSLIDMSAELRRAIVGDFGGALFVDAGQVGPRPGDFRIAHLQVGVGFGLRYRSPVGPIRADVGFPLDRPHGDAGWQFYVSLGRSF